MYLNLSLQLSPHTHLYVRCLVLQLRLHCLAHAYGTPATHAFQRPTQLCSQAGTQKQDMHLNQNDDAWPGMLMHDM